GIPSDHVSLADRVNMGGDRFVKPLCGGLAHTDQPVLALNSDEDEVPPGGPDNYGFDLADVDSAGTHSNVVVVASIRKASSAASIVWLISSGVCAVDRNHQPRGKTMTPRASISSVKRANASRSAPWVSE